MFSKKRNWLLIHKRGDLRLFLTKTGANLASKFRGLFKQYLLGKFHYGFTTVREMKHTSQQCCEKIMDGKMALYRECCFMNCTKSWCINLFSLILGGTIAPIAALYPPGTKIFPNVMRLCEGCQAHPSHWTGEHGMYHWRPQKIFHGVNVENLVILFRLLTMKCKWTFTKSFTPSSPLVYVGWTSFLNLLSEIFSTLRLWEMLLFINCLISLFSSTFYK